MHVSDPASTLYFPTTHLEHVPPLGPDDPALHVHLDRALLAAGAFEFGGHARHRDSDVASNTVEYLPASHAIQARERAMQFKLSGGHSLTPVYFPGTQTVHITFAEHITQAPPASAVVPALQVQSICLLLASGAYECVGHLWHVSDVPPTTVEYLPAPQWLHATLPLLSLYLPASHTPHASASGPKNPGAHIQDRLPADEREFAGHARHADSNAAPTAAAYLPATQSLQLTPTVKVFANFSPINEQP